MGVLTAGLDVGQRVDPSALAIVESVRETDSRTGRQLVRFLVRFLERLPLGTEHPTVARRVATVIHNAAVGA